MMTDLVKSFTISNEVVYFEKQLGNGYQLYILNDQSGDCITKYIVKDDKVLFEITVSSDTCGEGSYINNFIVNYLK